MAGDGLNAMAPLPVFVIARRHEPAALEARDRANGDMHALAQRPLALGKRTFIDAHGTST